MKTKGKARLIVAVALIAGLLLPCSILAIEHACLYSYLDPATNAMPRPTVEEIPNFDYVHPYLCRGALPSAYGILWLKDHGVTTIVDLRLTNSKPVELERLAAKRFGFDYVSLPVRYIPSSEQLKRFVEVVSAARDQGKRVFVHCGHGSDRTGFFVSVWRVVGDHWRVTLAMSEMLEHGFLIHRFRGEPEKTRPELASDGKASN